MILLYAFGSILAFVGLIVLLDWITTRRCPICKSAHIKWDRYNNSGSPNRQRDNTLRCLACGYVLARYERQSRLTTKYLHKSDDRNDLGSEPELDTSARSKIDETTIEWKHKKIQMALYKYLKENLGDEFDVHVEVGGIDILVQKSSFVYVIEIKSDDDVKDVVRSSIGQLLEYYTKLKLHNADMDISIISYGGTRNDDYARNIIKGYRDSIRLSYQHYSIDDESILVRGIKANRLD